MIGDRIFAKGKFTAIAMEAVFAYMLLGANVVLCLQNGMGKVGKLRRTIKVQSMTAESMTGEGHYAAFLSLKNKIIKN